MINDLNKLLKRCDLLMRPYALVIAPENKEQILKEMPHLQDKMKIIVCGLVEKDNGQYVCCNKCGYDRGENKSNYCPNCGADMRKQSEGLEDD